MSKRTEHYDSCPAGHGTGSEACVCEVLDEQLITQETKMNLADMIRAAKADGNLQARLNQYASV